MKKFFAAVLVLFNVLVFSSASDKDPWETWTQEHHFREYTSSGYVVRVEPLENFHCLKGDRNVIRVSVYNRIDNQFYYMHFITDKDWKGTMDEYNNNPELRAGTELYYKSSGEEARRVTDDTIAWFANDMSDEVMAVKDTIPSYYSEVGNSHHAYGWTREDREIIKSQNSR